MTVHGVLLVLFVALVLGVGVSVAVVLIISRALRDDQRSPWWERDF